MPQVLNFSIAYGKTAHGLSKDFKTSLEEAQETVNKWYADRPEVSSADAAVPGPTPCSCAMTGTQAGCQGTGDICCVAKPLDALIVCGR